MSITGFSTARRDLSRQYGFWMDLTSSPDAFLALGCRYSGEKSLCYMFSLFFFHFRIYYRKANSQGQFSGDILPAVLAQFIIMMHSLARLFSKMYSFHYKHGVKKIPSRMWLLKRIFLKDITKRHTNKMTEK